MADLGREIEVHEIELDEADAPRRAEPEHTEAPTPSTRPAEVEVPA